MRCAGFQTWTSQAFSREAGGSHKQITFIHISLRSDNHSASNMSDFHLATFTLVVTSLTLSPSCSV